MKISNQFYSPGQPLRYERTEDGFLRIHARVLREGIMPYGRDELSDIPPGCTADPIMMYVSMDTLKSGEALRSLEGSLLVAGEHKWITPENASEAGGHTAGAARIDGPYLEIDFLVTDPIAISRIESGELPEISAAYHAQSIFEPGDFDGQHFDARQTEIRFNHHAAVPSGRGRAGQDIKILNQLQKGTQAMADQTLVKVKLPHTGRYIFLNEGDVKEFEEDGKKREEEDRKKEMDGAAKDKSVEEKMKEHESLKAEFDAMKKELEESKGELAVIKKQLEELLKDETVEKKAGEMNEEQGEADEIIENCELKNEAGEELDEKKKDEFKNSYRKLHGTKLHDVVLKVAGIKIENMSADAKRGAFKALVAISAKAGGTKVAGTKLMIQNRGGEGNQQGSRESSLKMLGY